VEPNKYKKLYILNYLMKIKSIVSSNEKYFLKNHNFTRFAAKLRTLEDIKQRENEAIGNRDKNKQLS
jgi:hypothetical protein